MSRQMQQGRRPAGPGGFMGRGPGHGPAGAIGRPVEKAKDSKGTSRRLVGYLKPWGVQSLVVLIFAILSTAFSIAGPKIMGKATTRLYESAWPSPTCSSTLWPEWRSRRYTRCAATSWRDSSGCR